MLLIGLDIFDRDIGPALPLVYRYTWEYGVPWLYHSYERKKTTILY